MHFVTQLSNQDVVATRYYNLFAGGFGIFYRFPLPDAATSPNGAPFQDWKQANNPFIREARAGARIAAKGGPSCRGGSRA